MLVSVVSGYFSCVGWYGIGLVCGRLVGLDLWFGFVVWVGCWRGNLVGCGVWLVVLMWFKFLDLGCVAGLVIACLALLTWWIV